MQNTGGVCAEKAGQRLCPLHAYGGSGVADSDPGGQSSLTADEQGQELCVIRAKVATPLVLPSVCSALHRSQKLHGQECFVKERQSTPSLP